MKKLFTLMMVLVILASQLIMCNSYAESLVFQNGLSLLPADVSFGDSFNSLAVSAVKASADWTVYNFLNYASVLGDDDGFISFNKNSYSGKGHLGGEPTIYFLYLNEENKVDEVRIDFGFFESRKFASTYYTYLIDWLKKDLGEPLGYKDKYTSLITTHALKMASENEAVWYDEWMVAYGAGYLKIDLVRYKVEDDFKLNIGARYFEV